MEALELFAHPVRMRIIHAMSGDRVFTTAALGDLLPDVSKATLYRHVGVLAEAGVLEVAGEERVRGAVERRYRLRRDRAAVDAEMVASVTPEDHRRIFAAAVATLLAEFHAYLDRDGADPVADLVGYRQHALWLNPAELSDLIERLRAAIIPHLTHDPAPDRTRYLLSPILFPIEERRP
ncbi:helix-turn-helix domain-containing protein [Actinomadura sp. ATCC 31491]|uniref:Helix-turn-helix domain-containing protein n=1 Tax=Actinomadura luzonensis TaxID=2805427 RepID=A0ABT0FME2_9ACTN|nr:helix-turn-helix domain-containing protein [Actinomadura luzonensis]MCK2213441.1 helix-turn-helix domain-containing protein [Actinomadura luzonensis]